MDLLGKEVLARNFQPRMWHRLSGGDEYLLQECSVHGGWDWIENTWTLIRQEGQQQFSVGWRIYSGVELAAAIREAGFSQVELYGSLEGVPYDNKAERLVAIAQR
jgi:hypothetical protein